MISNFAISQLGDTPVHIRRSMPGMHGDERRRPVLVRVNYGAPPEHDILAIAALSVQEMFEFAAQASFSFA
jgi:hypothetical protein